MAELKIGIQLRSLRLPFRKALQTAQRLGASAVEIDARGDLRPQELSETGLRELRKMLTDLELRVAAVGYRTRRGYHVLDELDARVAGTKAAMKFAHDLGAPVVVNQVGPVGEDLATDEMRLLKDVLIELGRYGDHVGAYLAAETGTESGTRLGQFIDTLPAGTLAVNLDPGNLIVNGFSPLEAAEVLGPHVRHVHAKDGVRDLGQGRGIEVPLGRGSVDFPAIIGALEQHAYRGYYTIERERAENPELELASAVRYLRNL
ncbi:MAG: sugar phosphate isomerase/epimerase [Pirellulales bacterium]|nr:sugar phosphate isomerase/epimerase [Pirellulales bacterium]